MIDEEEIDDCSRKPFEIAAPTLANGDDIEALSSAFIQLQCNYINLWNMAGKQLVLIPPIKFQNTIIISPPL